MKYFLVLRPWQWAKNLLIFIPFILTDDPISSVIFELIVVFSLFSLFVSGTYILNDIRDHSTDINHPQKKLRPIASGKIKIREGRIYAYLLISFSVSTLSFVDTQLIIYFLIYLLFTTVYSRVLKYKNFFDSLSISTLFCLRIIIGSVFTNIQITSDLFLFVFFTSFYISMLKKNSIINTKIPDTNRYYKLLKKQNESIPFRILLFITGVFSNLSLNYWGTTFISSENVLNNISIITFMILYLFFTFLLYESSNKGLLEDFVYGITKNKKLISLIILQLILFIYFYF